MILELSPVTIPLKTAKNPLDAPIGKGGASPLCVATGGNANWSSESIAAARMRLHLKLYWMVAALDCVMLMAFHKPYGVLSRFTPDGSPNRPLSEFGFPKNVYPIGRLDADSEGLLLLSDEGTLNERLLHPRHAHEREYWVQVERVPAPDTLLKLAKGLLIQERQTLPCRAWILEPQPDFPPRDPPIRFRKTVPTCWIGLELFEGKNRQVRRMTAAVGHPTLRLIRMRIGTFEVRDLPPGAWRELTSAERKRVLL